MLQSRMEAKDGSFGFDFGATYTEVIPQKKLTYTIGDGRQASIDFTGDENQTKVTIVFDAEGTHPVDMQKNGWQAILNNFKSHTEAQ